MINNTQQQPQAATRVWFRSNTSSKSGILALTQPGYQVFFVRRSVGQVQGLLEDLIASLLRQSFGTMRYCEHGSDVVAAMQLQESNRSYRKSEGRRYPRCGTNLITNQDNVTLSKHGYLHMFWYRQMRPLHENWAMYPEDSCFLS